MMKFAQLLAILCLCGATVFGASVEIYPGSRRDQGRIELIGKESNRILFRFGADNYGAFPLKETKEADYVLSLWLPPEVKVTGIRQDYISVFQENPAGISENGMLRYDWTIPAALIKKRVLQGNWRTITTFWVDVPEALDAAAQWQLACEGEIVVQGRNRLVTVGTLDDSIPENPEYQLYVCQPGNDLDGLPENAAKKRVQYYKRLGITLFELIYGEKPRPDAIRQSALLQEGGLAVSGLRAGGFENLFAKYYYQEKNWGDGGIIQAMDDFCHAMETTEKQYLFQNTLPINTAYSIDWEPLVRRISPCYDDRRAAEAFAREKHLSDIPTASELREKFSQEFHGFIQKQLARPVESLRKALDEYRPGIPFYVTHGSGIPCADHDYKVLAQSADYLCPMLYTSSVLDFFHGCEAMVQEVGATKLLPLVEPCCAEAFNYRDVDTMTAALLCPAFLGTAGVGIWPGIVEEDGGMNYAIFRAQKLAAPVIGIFRHGKDAPELTLTPLPFQERKMQVGPREVDLSTPQWVSCSLLKARKHDGAYAIGIINLNTKDTLFTKVSVPLEGSWYLQNPDDKTVLPYEDNVLLRTLPGKSATWLLTRDRPENYSLLDAEVIAAEFRAEQSRASAEDSEIALGMKGGIAIDYANVEGLTLLEVKTASQTVGFSSLGGRILELALPGGPNLVSQGEQRGMGTDMFWLPKSGRWSGDHVAEMRLVRCANDGKTATIIYEGTRFRTLGGVTVTKTYTIEADKPGVKMEIEINNGNADPVNTFSLWTHFSTIFPDDDCEYIVLRPDGTRAEMPRTTGCYFNPAITGEECQIHAGRHTREAVQPDFGMWSRSLGQGILFRLPQEFMLNYRFGSDTNTADIMMLPVEIPHGQSRRYVFRLTPVQAPVLEDFVQALQADDNLVKALFSTTSSYLLDKEIVDATASLADGVLTLDMDGENPRIGFSTPPIDLKDGKKYLLTLDVEAENLKRVNPKGRILLYIYNFTTNKQGWVEVTGSGSGKLTLLLPFASSKFINGKKMPSILFRASGFSGTLRLSHPTLAEIPAEVNVQRGVMLPDGTVVSGATYLMK